MSNEGMMWDIAVLTPFMKTDLGAASFKHRASASLGTLTLDCIDCMHRKR